MPDESLQSMIEDWASHVFGLAKIFNIELDYSLDSIQKVELLCEMAYQQIASNPNTKEEIIYKTAKMIGAYLGEVIRKHLGGEWILGGKGIVEENKIIAIRVKNFECYPIEKVYKRLKYGSEENIEFYFKVCKTQMEQQK